MLGTESARMTTVLKYLTLLQERQTLIEAGMVQYLCETEGRMFAQGNVEALWEEWWLCQGWGEIHRQGDIEMGLDGGKGKRWQDEQGSTICTTAGSVRACFTFILVPALEGWSQPTKGLGCTLWSPASIPEIELYLSVYTDYIIC